MPVDTKAMIAGTYLQLVQHGNVDKITVKALIDACHISRQTFYYHFRDIMDVLEMCIRDRGTRGRWPPRGWRRRTGRLSPRTRCR